MNEPLKILDHFQSPSGFLLSILFVRIILNACFSVANKAPTTELYAAFWDVPIPGCIPIVFEKLFSLRFLVLIIVFPRDTRVDPRSLFACRMMRVQEETSTSQVGHKKGSSWESPTTRSLVASISMEELSSLYRVPDNISLELSDGAACSTIG